MVPRQEREDVRQPVLACGAVLAMTTNLDEQIGTSDGNLNSDGGASVDAKLDDPKNGKSEDPPHARVTKTLDDVPEEKRDLLRRITAIFAEPREGTQVEMLILFGSRARGDEVCDLKTGYISDVDLLVVVGNDKALADVALWGQLERRVRDLLGDTPLTMIVHDVHFINRQIRAHNYFFIDILSEGVELYNTRRRWFATPSDLSKEELLSQAEKHFRAWFTSATEFWRGSRYYTARNLLNHAAFSLHQAAERYFSAGHLVFTAYKRRTHDLETLSDAVGELHPLMVDMLPKTEPEDERLFDLLRRAYIESRYEPSYVITLDDLTELQSRVLVLAEKIRTACLEKMATFQCPQGVSQDLPVPPTREEPVLLDFPAPPENPQEMSRWAEQLAAVAAEKAELRWQQGRNEGLQEGLVEGESRAFQASVLLVLRSRGLDIPAEIEQKIAECADPVVLASWLSRAATIRDAAELMAS
ncbi:MAG TPA: nucleotidyltransferase and HEPN domain-containing protein [Pseudomonadota bacterium]|nr:nucleotidyltransferase and HEPN domain-containing protein [Pseudomonadota bacterium]